jgi:hypothetical protein
MKITSINIIVKKRQDSKSYNRRHVKLKFLLGYVRCIIITLMKVKELLWTRHEVNPSTSFLKLKDRTRNDKEEASLL